jgi:Tfp pilus assembly protein PilV
MNPTLPSRRYTLSGVALLEALISVAIIMTGVSSALFCIRNAVSSQSLLEKQRTGLALAQQQFAIVRAQGSSSIQNGERHPFAKPFEQFSWSANASALGEDSGLSFVTLTVSANSNKQQILKLSALMP